MAVVSSVSIEDAQRINDIRYPVIDTSEILEISEENRPVIADDKTYVAVGKSLKESQSTLQWVIDNSGGRQICIVHVHQPAEKIPFSGIIHTHQVVAYHKAERQRMLQLLDRYKHTCHKAGVCVELKYIEMDSIEKGIVDFILQHNVRSLVMGAAADKHYSRRMVDLKSKKAIYVSLQAAPSCQIQFVCKGNIIFTRPGRLDGVDVSTSSSSLLLNANSDSGQSPLMARSVSEGQNTKLQINRSTQDYRRVMSDNHRTRISTTLPDINVGSMPDNGFNSGRASAEWGGMSQRSLSSRSRLSTVSSEVVDDSASITYTITEGSEVDTDFGAVPRFIENAHNLLYMELLQERGASDELYDQLVQAMADSENSKREAFDESIRRRKTERDTIEAKRKTKASENLYAEELRRRRESEETLEKIKGEHRNLKKELVEISEELRMTLEHKSSLKSQVAVFHQTVQELEQKMLSTVELLQNYKRERDELQLECDDALRLAEELREMQSNEASSSSVSKFYTEFLFAEVKDATHNFDPIFKIGEGAYGSIFRGFLRHTEVAIKILHSQESSEFQQEVNVLSKLRHPNIVILLGACPDASIIIYEYLSGGSLEDRLNCKHNTPPLSMQHRILIAAELCSVLIFLHSCGIVHGDLNPANLLLDKNLVTKLINFGTCGVLSRNKFAIHHTSSLQTDAKSRLVYVPPEVLSSGELTSKSDTFSFGIILLRLLTGKPAIGLTKEVQQALNKDNLKSILDPTAGDWAFVQVQQLVILGMNCCDLVWEKRPDLASEAWKVLEPMRVSCGPSLFRYVPERQSQIPHYFNCPIFQEMMDNPVVAADGYTYEAEAIKGWLDSGHNTSPMTNLELPNSSLVPNKALRSAIQEWLQHP
uniref:U-box domain-containing protein 33-like n=1 Tax=Erigeron canadensis TaxID=72917 RepID=UPI001CB959BF|nr:U-box domain-containing protein 33-like [Erigeron canadensis]